MTFMNAVYSKGMNRKHVLVGVVGAAVFSLVCVVFLLGLLQLQPVNPSQTETVRFVIPKNQTATVIGERLAAAGLIRNPLVFTLWVRAQGMSNAIQAGSFDLSTAMTMPDIAQELTQGTQDTWITIREGWRVEEIAEYLAEQDLDEFDADAFIALAKPQEGKLFPDTYLIPREMETAAIVSLLTTTFDQKLATQLAAETEASTRDFAEVLVMASLVQREGRDADQMKHIAGILWNRIRIGMALQVDATLQYVKGNSDKWWPTPLSADKQLVSPYNTYLNPGLPPTPISNPGIDALRAALDPLEVDDLYYLHDPSTGKMYTAESLDQHNANINRYLR
jgi:UPF0755 protein